MKNLLGYVKEERRTFAQAPFTETDALALGWLAYFNYADPLRKGRGVPLSALGEGELLPAREMYADAYNPKTSRKLFAALRENPRFSRAVLSRFSAERDETREIQFGALCIEYAPNEFFLAFRGTDPSFLGWKEDFNIARFFPIPSQTAAANYAREAMCAHPFGVFCFGGHSKGGTNAVYAASRLAPALRERLRAVYNFDGPGFFQDIAAEEGYRAVENRIIKLVPRASFVGMILESGENFAIVRSRTVSVLQHDPFSWRVREGKFCRAEKRTRASVRLSDAFNGWIFALTPEERERFIGLVFGALDTLDTHDFTVFFKTLYRQVPALFKRYLRLPAADRRFFREALGRFFRLWLRRRKGSAPHRRADALSSEEEC